MSNFFKKIAILLTLVFLLSSCVGMENIITFNPDGSGTIIVQYRISKIMIEMGGEENEVPLPFTEDSFAEEFEGVEGLELVSVTQTEDEKDIIVNAEINFDSIETLIEVESFNSMPMSLEKEGGEYVFKQLITEGSKNPEEEMDPQTEELIQSLFAGYTLSFTVNTPSAIKYNNLGELSNNNTVTLDIPIVEFSKIKEETVFIVKW